jgi:hypothetical protein
MDIDTILLWGKEEEQSRTSRQAHPTKVRKVLLSNECIKRTQGQVVAGRETDTRLYILCSRAVTCIQK